MRTRLLAVSTAILLSACAFSQAQPEAPAVITQPSAASRAELLSAVTGALNVADVTLADDALTKTSTLTIERTRRHDASGRQLNGRDLGRPEVFKLVKKGTRCVLIHQGSGKRIDLPNTTCEHR